MIPQCHSQTNVPTAAEYSWIWSENETGVAGMLKLKWIKSIKSMIRGLKSQKFYTLQSTMAPPWNKMIDLNITHEHRICTEKLLWQRNIWTLKVCVWGQTVCVCQPTRNALCIWGVFEMCTHTKRSERRQGGREWSLLATVKDEE